jgi:hypothetical protein
MASFMSNLFQGAGKQDKTDHVQPPATPTKNSFTTPVSTPQGSPSKKMVPPGANDLPDVMDNLKLTSTNPFESPLNLGRPQSLGTPLSPGKTNIQTVDENSPFVDDSIIHKGVASAGSPLKGQGQENTPPTSSRPVSSRGTPADTSFQPSHAAITRQGLYQLKERPSTPAKKFNTSRGLTPEEREILQKPNVKRLVNVAQLCNCFPPH